MGQREYALDERWISEPIRRIDRLVHSAGDFNSKSDAPLQSSISTYTVNLQRFYARTVFFQDQDKESKVYPKM